MFLLMTLSIGVAVGAETHGNPQLNRAGVTQTVSATQPGGNMEGKEVRFGPPRPARGPARRRARRTAR